MQQKFDQPGEVIPGIARIERGDGGLKRIVVTTPKAAAIIYTHGAHLAHFQPAGREPVLWMSKSSWLEDGKPIRGGVPICFPWFGPRDGDPQAPNHGFVRWREWRIDSIHQQGDNAVDVHLSLEADDATRKWWPVDFGMSHIIRISTTLEMRLEVENRSRETIQFEEALHTYLTVGDIRQITVEGLGGTAYIDKAGGIHLRQQVEPIIDFTGETDRVYLDTQATCIVNDPVMKRRIEISKSGSDATVVWNPWNEKARAMPDFGDDEWPGMLCIETANAAKHAVQLAPGMRHTMAARVRLI